MKKCTCLIFVVFMYSFITISYASVGTGLLAYYSFENSVEDKSGNGFDGNLIGNTMFKKGKIGQSLYLDGTGDYVELGNGLNLNPQCTVAVWIKTEDVLRRYPAIFSKYETNHYGPYDFDLHYDKVNLWISDGNGGYMEVDSNSSIIENEWTHVTWVINNTSARIYINGELDIQGQVPLMTNNSDKVTIGRQAFLFDNYDLEFKGYIDELRIYNRALSQTEVFQLYNQTNKSSLIPTLMLLLN